MKFTSSLNIFDNETTIVLEKRMLLLKMIDLHGSISSAAKAVPLSYKGAWDAIDSINNLTPQKVVEKKTGGKDGGGAKLTKYGKNLLQTYEFIKIQHDEFLQKLSSQTDFNNGTLKSLSRVGMQLSARNQIIGVIEKAKKNKINCVLHLRLKNNSLLSSVIAKTAYDLLDLKTKSEVVATFKSSSVMIALDKVGENVLKGIVKKIVLSEVMAEVTIDIGGDFIVSSITSEAVNNLNLKKGDECYAIIKPSDILIGK